MTQCKSHAPAPILFDILSVMLPSPPHTWLLDACLSSKERGRQAWAKWRESIDDPVHFLGQQREGFKTFLPLLLAALIRNEVRVESSVLTHLRTAYVREEMRQNTFRKISRSVFNAFNAANLPFITLKGAALADLVYEKPVLRHSHDIDLLIREENLPQAFQILTKMGFLMERNDHRFGLQTIRMKHESDLPLNLTNQLFNVPFFNTGVDGIWRRSEEQLISETAVRVLSPTDNLLHISGDAVCSRKHGSMEWVIDSFMIINQYRNLDWDLLLNQARCRRLTLPLSRIFGFLNRELDVPIPQSFLEALNNSAGKTTTLDRDIVLSCAHAWSQGQTKALYRRATTWRTQAAILRWLFLPSPSYLRWKKPFLTTWLLPLYYAYLPFKYLAFRNLGQRG